MGRSGMVRSSTNYIVIRPASLQGPKRWIEMHYPEQDLDILRQILYLLLRIVF